ncbi:uncharacterized protein Aven [Diabrotica undecimpunctata]|uniref:uncharacterized protein Aven n=1 Tax=Diabrotica undecimpunctata TaxID=50387 RepID=UPI003B6387A4
MEHDKSRGLKHIKDKKKYKGNSTKNAKYVPQKSKPNLESNWYRYEDEEIQDESVSTTDTDFAILADAPITKGKHFQTKSDKLLASETESTAIDQFFTLNLGQLEESLMTIPFYERMGIDRKYFSESQIRFMNSEADENLKKYLGRTKPRSHEILCGDSGQEPEEIVEKLSLEDSIMDNIKNTNEKQKDNQELEKWLDDFLDE